MKIHQSNNKWVSSPITVIFGRCMLNEESIVVDGWFRSGTHPCHHIQRNEIPIPHEGRRILHDPIVMRRFHLQVELLDTFDFAKADVFQQHRQEFFRKTHLYTYKHTQANEVQLTHTTMKNDTNETYMMEITRVKLPTVHHLDDHHVFFERQRCVQDHSTQQPYI